MRRTATAAIAGVALAALIGAGMAAAHDGQGPGGRLGEALSELVGKGTITQQQADSVEEALTDSWAEERQAREQDREDRRAEIDALLQSTIGADSEDVMEQLREGKTLLEIAGDSAEELADGMLALLTQRLDRAVEEGRITEEQAAETLTRAGGRAKAWLEGDDSRAGRGWGLGLLLGRDSGMAEGMGAGMGPGAMWGGRGHHGGPGHGPGGWYGGDRAADGANSSSAASIAWQI